MSTIIDALKRSDRERQINTTHTMSYSHLSEDKDGDKAWFWYVLLAVLITVTSVVVITLWFNRTIVDTSSLQLKQNTTSPVENQTLEKIDSEITTPIIETPKAAPKAVSPKSSVTKQEEPPIQNSRLAGIAQSDVQNAAQQVRKESRTSLSELVIVPVPKNEIVESPVVMQQSSEETQVPATVPKQVTIINSNEFSGYDKYASIRASQKLPELHLDILMYHPNASQRKAYINMQSYTQGEQISEGAQLLEIGEKGVLLRYQGKDFVLSAN